MILFISILIKKKIDLIVNSLDKYDDRILLHRDQIILNFYLAMIRLIHKITKMMML